LGGLILKKLSKQDLQDLIAASMESAKETLLKKPEIPLEPMFIVLGHKDGKDAVGYVPLNGLQKHFWKMALRKSIDELDGYAAIQVTESWLSIKTVAEWDGTLPSDDPNHMDAICVYGRNSDGARGAMVQVFTRKGKLIEFKDNFHKGTSELNCKHFDGIWEEKTH
jgi:hypothetical protein